MKWYKFSDSIGKHNEILKLLAILSMVIDHIGYVFFPDIMFLRIIGRIAFPIFAYQVAKGYIHTSNKNKYITRLWIFALISQIPYTLLFDTFNLNILFTLLLSLFLIDRIHNKEWYWIFPFAFLSLLPFFAPNLPTFDYGWYGLLTPLLFYLFTQSKPKALTAQIILTLLYYWLDSAWEVQLFAIAGVLIALYLPTNKWKIHLNKYFFYWFYPAHLAILLIVKLTLIFFIFSP